MKRLSFIALAVIVICGMTLWFLLGRGGKDALTEQYERQPLLEVTPDGTVGQSVVEARERATQVAKKNDLYAIYRRCGANDAKVSLVYLMLLSHNEQYLAQLSVTNTYDWREVQVMAKCLDDQEFSGTSYGQQVSDLLAKSLSPSARLWAAERLLHRGPSAQAVDELNALVKADVDEWSVRAARALCGVPDQRRHALIYICDRALKGGVDQRAAVGVLSITVDDPFLDEQLLAYIKSPSEATARDIVAKLPEFRKRLTAQPK